MKIEHPFKFFFRSSIKLKPYIINKNSYEKKEKKLKYILHFSCTRLCPGKLAASGIDKQNHRLSFQHNNMQCFFVCVLCMPGANKNDFSYIEGKSMNISNAIWQLLKKIGAIILKYRKDCVRSIGGKISPMYVKEII